VGLVRTAAGGVFRAITGKGKDKEELERLKLGPKRGLPPQVARFADTGLFRRPLTEEEERRKLGESKPKPSELRVQRKAEGMPNLSANVASEIQAARGGGNALPLSVRRFMEPRFKADFSKVRVHTGDRAAKLNRQVNAKAFAVGGDVFFGKGQFQPETGEGRELIAHELTHTIQQGASRQAPAVQRSEDTTVSHSSPEGVQRLGISDALDYFADKANLIPGFRMLTIILGVNPVNMSRVERSAANIMRAIVEFIPGGGLITKALDNYGVFDKVGAWVEQQIETLGMTGSLFKQAIDEFLDSLSWSDIFDLGGVWSRAKRIFTEPVDRLISFAKGLITGILGFIRDAILRPLAGLAQGTRGYDLIKALMGQDPITGDPYPRTPDTVIGGFMKFIGQEDVWENIKKGNAIGKAWAWFQESLSGLMAQVRAAPGKFMDAVRSLTLEDLVLLPRAFGKVAGVFLDIIGGFFSWAAGQVMKLLMIVFEVVSPGAAGYIQKTGAALLSILKNPLPFVANLGRAAKGGFMGFKDRFGTHLKKGLIDWLTGSLPGIYIPTAFSLPELVKFVFSVLGLTWANVRAKLVKAVGETAVKAMETTFDIVKTLITQGPAAAWDKIKEALGSLQDMVVGGITDLVVDAVTKKAIPKLVAMFIPGAGFITAILSIYDMVMVFVNKISRIIQVVTGFVNSITAIAAGNVTVAVKRVEDVLAGLLTLAINFLAGFAGLGRVSDKIMGVLAKVRAPIDKALDALIAWIVGMARKLGKYVAQAGVPNDPNERLRLASRDAVAAANRFSGRRVGAVVLQPLFGAIRVRYGLTSLEPFERAGRWWVRASINPQVESGTGAATDKGGPPGATAETGMPAPLPRVEVPFSLGRESHKLILEPQGERASLKMASVPGEIESKYIEAHTALDNWKRYLANIQDPELKRKFETLWLAKINSVVRGQTEGYKEMYKKHYDRYAKRLADIRRNKPNAPAPQPAPPPEPAADFVGEATAVIQDLIAQMRAAVLLQEAGDLSAPSIEHLINEEGTRLWAEEWNDRKKRVEAILAKYKGPNGEPILYHGSLARGARGPHKGRIRFDPDAFDIDA
ncbi:MAG TPA: DUF4157 domain-containing protein, partial [Longimicrobium sp.]|nr:DUF4157 domain-containing protein [Longimicrobium sp.]